MDLFGLVWSIVDLLLYNIYLGFDIKHVVDLFESHSLLGPLWSVITLLYTIMPMIIASIMVLSYMITTNQHKSTKCLAIIGAIVGCPIMPNVILLWNIVEKARGHDTDRHPIWTLKLFYAFVKLYPEAVLKMNAYFIFQYYVSDMSSVMPSYMPSDMPSDMHTGNIDMQLTSLQYRTYIEQIHSGVKSSQWITVAVPLITIAVLVSTSKLFDEYNKTPICNRITFICTRITFLLFGLLAVVSRILATSAILIAPQLNSFGGLIISMLIFIVLIIFVIIVSDIIRCFPCYLCEPLDSTSPHDSNMRPRSYILFILMTITYNAFTITGLIISTLTLVFSIILLVWNSWYLDYNLYPVTSEGLHIKGLHLYQLSVRPYFIFGTSLAAVSWVSNVIITTVPFFNGIKTDWLKINNEFNDGFKIKGSDENLLLTAHDLKSEDTVICTQETLPLTAHNLNSEDTVICTQET